MLSALASTMFITGCGGGDDNDKTSPGGSTANLPPIVSISNAITEAKEKEAFTLTADASDSDGSIASYSWAHDSSLAIESSSTNTNNPSFKVPDINEDIDISFTVTVTDNQGATSSNTHKLLVKRIVSNVTISGLVTDQPIANANVKLSTGDTVIEVTANQNGAYSAQLQVDESQFNKLVKISAFGIGIQENVEFASQLNSVSALIEQAGEDNTLDKSDNFGVNITNVSTAEFALLNRSNQSISSDEELNRALLNVSADEKIELATLIKIVVDNDDYKLPEGVISTLDLVDDEQTAESFKQEVNEKDPGLIEETKQEILADEELVDGLNTALIGQYIINSPQFHQNRAYHLNMNDDGTGELFATNKSDITWQETNSVVTLTLAQNNPLIIDTWHEQESSTEATYKQQVTEIEFTVLAENEVFRSIEVIQLVETYKDDVLEETQQQTFITNLINKQQTSKISEQELVGTWYLQNFTDKNSDDIEIINFKADGSALSLNNEQQQYTWEIDEQKLIINYQDSEGDGSVAIWLTKSQGEGYQIVGLDTSIAEWSDTLYGLFFKKQPDLVIEKSHIIGRWQGFIGRPQERFDMNINEDLTVRIGMTLSGSQGRFDDGIFYRERYILDDQIVRQCDTNDANCYLSYQQKYNFIAILDGQYFIHREETWFNNDGMISDTNEELFIYNYSTAGYQEFTNEMLYGNSHFYYKNSQGEVTSIELTTEYDNDNNKTQYISIAGETYEIEIIDGLLHYTDNNSQAFIIELVNNIDNEFTICWYQKSESCQTENRGTWTFEAPTLSITTTSDGNGAITPESIDAIYGSETVLKITASEGYIINTITGCNGTLESGNQYRISNIQSDCEVSATFKTISGLYYFNDLDYYLSKAIKLQLNDDLTGEIGITNTAKITWSIENDIIHITPIEESIYLEYLTWDYSQNPSIEVQNKDAVSQLTLTPHPSFGLNGYKLDFELDHYENEFFISSKSQSHELTQLESTEFIALAESDLVGQWSMSLIDGVHIFDINNDGSLTITDLETNQAEINNWQITTTGFSFSSSDAVTNVLFTKDIDVGYQFIFEGQDSNNSEGVEPGFMVHRNEVAITADNFSGNHVMHSGHNIDDAWGEYQIYPDGTIMFLTSTSSIQGKFENDQYIRRRYWDENTNDRNCDPSLASCHLIYEVTYKLIAQANSRYFIERTWVDYNESTGAVNSIRPNIFAVEYNQSTKVEQFNEYNLYGWTLYSDTSVKWKMYEEDSNYFMQYDDGEVFPFTLEQGKLRTSESGTNYYIELIDNTKTSITVCKYLVGESCLAENQHELSFNN